MSGVMLTDFSYDDSRDADQNLVNRELNPDDDEEDDNENRSQGRMGDESNNGKSLSKRIQ